MQMPPSHPSLPSHALQTTPPHPKPTTATTTKNIHCSLQSLGGTDRCYIPSGLSPKLRLGIPQAVRTVPSGWLISHG